MTIHEGLAWIEQLIEAHAKLRRMSREVGFAQMSYGFDPVEVQAWVAEASAALADIFPASHAIRREWANLEVSGKLASFNPIAIERMRGVMTAASKMIREGRLSSLLDGVRAETSLELLDQADVLCSSGYLVAAAVIAGGALESHLAHLIVKHGLQINGDGSISKYDGAIAKARNEGLTKVYDQLDSKRIIVWGAIRNEAAHSPVTFARSREDVSQMISGIKDFVQRTT